MKRFVLFLLLLLCVTAPVAADGPSIPDDLLLPRGDHPLGPWDGTPPPSAAAAADEAWSFRTGYRKGIAGMTLAGERMAAPDIAVLKSGFFRSWAGLLALIREPTALAEPDALAGLSSTKPVLIIPSGGLAGLSSSAYFRAGLAQYVTSGGVVLCFAQQQGADLSALPVPPDSKQAVDGAGWTEDGGPLFGASQIVGAHPALAGLAAATPSIETDGFIGTIPAGGTILLARPDGKATLAVYPVGQGWVALSAMAVDYSYSWGVREPDEQALLRGLVLWAKAGGKPAEAAPGASLERRLAIAGPVQGTSATVVTRLMGGHDDPPLDERSYPLSLAAATKGPIDFSAALPRDVKPGIYHVEYRLLDGKKQPLSPVAEASDAWFVVPSRVPVPATAPAGIESPSPAEPGIEIIPSITFTGDEATLALSLTGTGDAAADQQVVVRAGGRDRKIVLKGKQAEASFDLGPLRSAQAVPYAVRRADGRTIARGTVLASPALGPRVTLARAAQAADGSIRIEATGLGTGELTITAPGSVARNLISADSAFDLPLPGKLPSGVYPVLWEFNGTTGQHREGVLPLAIRGITARCVGASFASRKGGEGELRLIIDASEGLRTEVKLRLVGPHRRQAKTETRTVSLVEGRQTVKLPYAFRPDQAGLWHLLYELTTTLPQGPGLDRQTHTLASGRLALDAGPAAVIGVALKKPMYYGTDEGAQATVYVHGTGPARLDLLVDGKRLAKKRTEGPGTSAVTVSLGNLSRGRHELAAVLPGAGLQDRRSLSFLFGALLPDLTVSLRTSDLAGPLMEVGIGIRNEGRTPAPHSTVTLYEGDPGDGGKPIGSSPVPPLEPGKQFVVVLPWQLAGKAGARRLTAVVDRDGAIAETDDDNNSSVMSLHIPAVLLAMMSQKPSYASDDDIRYRVRVVNYSSGGLRNLSLTMGITDPAGGVVSRSTVTVPPLGSGEERTMEFPLAVPSPKEGTYVIGAEVRAARPLASDSLGITILPTLLLTGTLAGTGDLAVPCMPFEIRYAARDAGNVKAVNGRLTVEIRPKSGGPPVFTKRLPFTLAEGSFRMERVDLPRGAYSIVLTGSAVNSQWNMSREFVLASRDLTVEGPVTVTRSRAAVPRILVWSGGGMSIPIEQALAEKIVREAFDGEMNYYETAASANEFRSKALTGLFNVYLLFEVREIGETVGVLRHAIGLGSGVIIIGPGEHARSLAESLGFRFAPVKRSVSHLSFPGSSPLGLTGSLPVSGRVFSVAGNNATAVAVLRDGKAAAALDGSGGGKVLAVPFSPIRSALDSGASAPYALLLRSAVQAVMPEQEQPDVSSIRLEIASRAGPVRTRIAENLPPNAEVLWMSAGGKQNRGTLSFELTAEKEPRAIMYLIRAPGAEEGTTTEVFSECGGTLKKQETAE